MMKIFSFCLFFLAWLTYSAVAEDTTVSENSETSHLDALESNLYPSFVSSDTTLPDFIEEDVTNLETPDQSPEEIEPEAIVDLVVETGNSDPYSFEPIAVLVGDLASTDTWKLIREHIDPTVENIQVLMVTQEDEKTVKLEYRKLAGDLNALIEMAPYQAPIQLEGLSYYRNRILKQQKYLIQDYINQDAQRFDNTLPLLQLSLSRFNSLLFQSDLDRGAAPPEVYDPPTDWTPKNFQTHNFSNTIKPWTTRHLYDGYVERYNNIVYMMKKNREFRDSETLYEMGEISRELSTRIYDVPVTARMGFRNATLRLDVMSENLLDYTKENNYPHTKRHLYAIKRGIEVVEGYLNLKKAPLKKKDSSL
jgi:hypothetical protein